MAAAVLDRVDRASGAFEQEALAEQHFAPRLTLLQFLSEQGGVPVVPQPQFCV